MGREEFPRVCVVTPTKNRPDRLLRAMTSVEAQVGVTVHHIVLGDDCPFLADAGNLEELSNRFPGATIRNVRRSHFGGVSQEELEYIPGRLAHLRNLGIKMADAEYVAHLDDDNVFHPTHLRSLVDLLRANPAAQVAHSWRRLLTQEGVELVPDGEDPWYGEPAKRAHSYERLRALGIFEPGSCVMRDTLRVGDQIRGVDTSECLVRASLHEQIPFPTRFSQQQKQLGYTEDLAFSQELVRQDVPVLCSQQATVDYFMGGHSNSKPFVELRDARLHIPPS
ncbi:glycosyltransferase family 2 protein [Streptomyces sp. XD-27]|uniref:glycosyltransferase family 2 protein n=1 Tax=Streptomyces sp. XD-27 TaxID=3062779 RepID=UPI0026F41F89|nr:glycosyltransferase family 2 protein [Streptomyces sp. XD-27]WKX69368.1 glycosyltransferase family 2 protein [Streptomyces sp. XD-27]